jgi:glycine cleavage system H lipoate-binding protein
VNDDAYAAWLFRIRPSESDALSKFMDADAYQKLTPEP